MKTLENRSGACCAHDFVGVSMHGPYASNGVSGLLSVPLQRRLGRREAVPLRRGGAAPFQWALPSCVSSGSPIMNGRDMRLTAAAACSSPSDRPASW